MNATSTYGDYIFYADESGDHSLTSIDEAYPVFALSLCAFNKGIYCSRIVPKFQRLKFKYFGHDAIVLHEHDIRKQNGPFKVLTDGKVRLPFLAELEQAIVSSSFRIMATVIHKSELRYDLFPENPYSIALKICLQQAYRFLETREQHMSKAHFVFEKRGKKEDEDLELVFRRVTDGDNDMGISMRGFEIHFADKRTNSTGMQVADLTARPIGLSVFRKHQRNRAFELINKKLYRTRRYAQPVRGIFIP